MAAEFVNTLIALYHRKSIPPIAVKDAVSSSLPSSSFHHLYRIHWKQQSPASRLRMLLLASFALISVYIVAPTISYHLQSKEEREKMFSSKRRDKYTTGLINTRNDCFANSSVQAFASLPGLNLYLNDILYQYNELLALEDELNLIDLPKLPLHHALAVILSQLQDPITTTKAISVWPFLNVIESIFNSKISPNQNDAHELVQLILETLENELIKLKKYIKKDNNLKKKFKIPELPFNGLLVDQLTCLSCGKSSTPSFHPFSVFSLPVPESNNAKLTEMLKKTESETISGYNCLRCKISAILKIEDNKCAKGVALSEEESQTISELKILDQQNVSINHDLSEKMESFIKHYKYESFVSEKLKSTIVKRTLIVKAPKLLTVHLSRSMFTGQFFTRNGCCVAFDEELCIEIDDDLVEIYEDTLKAAKLKNKTSKKQQVAASIHLNDEVVDDDNDDDDDDDEDDAVAIVGYDDDRNEPEHLAKLHPKVLTKHQEEDDRVKHQVEQDEDVSSQMDDLHLDDGDENLSGSKLTTFENPGDSDDEIEEESFEEEAHEVLPKENVKYRLRAIIRHQGTHNAGHYECYRHKPLFVKDIESDKVITLSPTINIPEAPSENQQQQQQQQTVNNLPTPASSSSPTSSHLPADQPAPPTTATAHDQTAPLSPPTTASDTTHSTDDSEDSSSFSRFRNRINSIVGKRPSGPSTNGSTPRVTSVQASGTHPPAASNEPNGHGLTSVSESRENGPSGTQAAEDPRRNVIDKKKCKKISTVSRYPFWKISDTVVSESRIDDVLREKNGVYMIYYEKI